MQENNDIETFIDILKGLLFSDNRLDKASAFFAVDDVNIARKRYEDNKQWSSTGNIK